MKSVFVPLIFILNLSVAFQPRILRHFSWKYSSTIIVRLSDGADTNILEREAIEIPGNETDTVAEEDPIMAAIKEEEYKLALQVDELERTLKNERNLLSKTKDKISESGKNGYFIVQAQVNEFLRKKESDQKSKVSRNKRDFVLKMLPIVDAFRAAPLTVPATTEREQTMHTSFSALLTNLLLVFGKFGYTEYNAEVGLKYDASLHEVGEVRLGDENGIILEQLRSGYVDSEGLALRRALVAISEKCDAVASSDAEKKKEEGASTGGEPDT